MSCLQVASCSLHAVNVPLFVTDGVVTKTLTGNHMFGVSETLVFRSGLKHRNKYFELKYIYQENDLKSILSLSAHRYRPRQKYML